MIDSYLKNLEPWVIDPLEQATDDACHTRQNLTKVNRHRLD